MRWTDVRQTYPDQWLIIEALEAHTEDDRRHLDRIAVIETCPDGESALMLTAARLRHVASTKWGTKRYLNMNLLEDKNNNQGIA